mgnify:FL=1
MEADEQTIRRDLACTLSAMAESVMKREPPFDRMPLQPEVAPYLYRKYLQYFDELEVLLRDRVYASLAEHARWDIQMRLGLEKRGFNFIYPQHVDAKKDFMAWILEKEGPRPPVPPLQVFPMSKFNMREVITKTVLKRMPELRPDKMFREPSTTVFSIPILYKNKIFLIADKGTNRKFIDIYFCIYYPESYFDIAIFFSNSQSHYEYSSEDDVVTGMNKALDIIEILFPQFVDRVKKVLSRGQ